MTEIHEWSNAGRVIHGDCLEVLRTLEDNSVDAIITDPPAGISFMGKEWDNPDYFPLRHHRGKLATHSHERGFAGGIAELKTGKKERDAFIAFMQEVMQEALRVLKPGGHALVWSLPRTSHWTATALEDAGFEIRDNIYHIFGSGFPKSLDVSKQIDRKRDDSNAILLVTRWINQAVKNAGISHDAILKHFGFKKGSGQVGHWTALSNGAQPTIPTWEQWLELKSLLNFSDEMDAEAWRLNGRKGKPGDAWNDREIIGEKSRTGKPPQYMWGEDDGQRWNITAPATPAAQQYAGFGTALKPAVETWWLCRKPLAAKSVADNVLQYGTGAINIDACRVACTDKTPFPTGVVSNSEQVYGNGKGRHDNRPRPIDTNPSGRWPSHLLLSHTLLCDDDACADDCPVRALDAQSGTSKSPANYARNATASNKHIYGKLDKPIGSIYQGYGDEGGASRYFQQFYYSAKTSRAERNAGCANLPPAQTFDKNKSAVIQRRDPETGETTYSEYSPSSNQNTHPTVKPQSLMRWLVKLITPPDGIVLDMFGGSGSTALACIAENKRFILVERESEYVEIAKARIVYALEQEQKCSA